MSETGYSVVQFRGGQVDMRLTSWAVLWACGSFLDCRGLNRPAVVSTSALTPMVKTHLPLKQVNDLLALVWNLE